MYEPLWKIPCTLGWASISLAGTDSGISLKGTDWHTDFLLTHRWWIGNRYWRVPTPHTSWKYLSGEVHSYLLHWVLSEKAHTGSRHHKGVKGHRQRSMLLSRDWSPCEKDSFSSCWIHLNGLLFCQTVVAG